MISKASDDDGVIGAASGETSLVLCHTVPFDMDKKAVRNLAQHDEGFINVSRTFAVPSHGLSTEQQ